MTKAFSLSSDNYLDTPFFIYLSNNLTVIDIFKTPYLQSEELKKWLLLILNQKML